MFGPGFVICVQFLPTLSSFAEELELVALRYTVSLFVYALIPVPHGAIDWSVINDCGTLSGRSKIVKTRI